MVTPIFSRLFLTRAEIGNIIDQIYCKLLDYYSYAIDETDQDFSFLGLMMLRTSRRNALARQSIATFSHLLHLIFHLPLCHPNILAPTIPRSPKTPIKQLFIHICICTF